MTDEEAYEHEPVLADRVVEWLELRPGGLVLDGTVGGGGHAARSLEADPGGRLVGLDRDPAALEAAGRRLARFGDRVTLLRGDYRDARVLLERYAPEAAGRLTGALLDLGISSPQVDRTARGFSFRPRTPLDMRMGGTTGGGRTAADWLNQASEEELGRIFRDYGEERRWRALAREVARRRRERSLQTSDDLVAAIRAALGPRMTAQDKARLFQAVRIAVNDELGALEEGLPALRDLLAPGGRLAVIAYHSLEDRRVKHTFREWSTACVCPPRLPVCRCRGRPLGRTLTSRPVRPDEEEVACNPRARSARLRVWEKATGEDEGGEGT